MREFTVIVSGTPASGCVGVPIVHRVRASTIRKGVDKVLEHIRVDGEHQRLETHLKIGYISVKICLSRLNVFGISGPSVGTASEKKEKIIKRRIKATEKAAEEAPSKRDLIRQRMAALAEKTRRP